MAKKLRILIADDQAIFRRGLKDIFVDYFPKVTVGEAEAGESALELVRKANWNLVMLDVTMPGRNGVDVLREIRRLRPALPVLGLSMHPEEQYAWRVLKAGAVGYITKMKAPLEVISAVETVLAGGKYISPTLTEQLMEQSQPDAEKLPHERLTNREYQVMCLTPSGKSLKEIAGELSISVQTVSTHRARILKKMGLHTSAGLIRYALENRLVD
jgi:two-component system, NarL family, invasion response regulator UvrY